MPTGYTDRLYKGEQTFPEFAWRCARAFGVFVRMRDVSLDVPGPVVQEPDIEYETRRKAEAEAERERLRELTYREATAAARAEYDQEYAAWLENEEHVASVEARFRAMRAQVEAFVPPTEEHEGLKSFMLQQLDTELGDRYQRPAPVLKSGEEWTRAAVARAKADIAYYEKRIEEEITRTAQSNAWLAALATVIPPPENAQVFA